MELLPGEQEVSNGIIITERSWAAEIISKVGGHTDYGSYPHDVSAFDLGRAVGRSLTNCNEDDPIAELTRGLNHYYSVRHRNFD